MKYGMGQSVSRVEDPRMLTGRGRYVDDLVRWIRIDAYDLAFDDVAAGRASTISQAHASTVAAVDGSHN